MKVVENRHEPRDLLYGSAPVIRIDDVRMIPMNDVVTVTVTEWVTTGN